MNGAVGFIAARLREDEFLSGEQGNLSSIMEIAATRNHFVTSG